MAAALTTQRLSRLQVQDMIERLADDLTPRQRGRLAELAESIGDDGMIAFSRALEVTTTGSDERARQAAFRQFRKSVRSAASAVGVAFSIEVDGQKIAPTQRRCWFEGTDMAEARLTDMARHEASGGAHRVDPWERTFRRCSTGHLTSSFTPVPHPSTNTTPPSCKSLLAP